jgi:hypothetical protein
VEDVIHLIVDRKEGEREGGRERWKKGEEGEREKKRKRKRRRRGEEEEKEGKRGSGIRYSS